jgi:hypothetical protein
MPLVTAAGQAPVGAIQAMVARDVLPQAPATAVVAACSSGLIQDYGAVFEQSPAAAAVTGPVTALDAYGSGASEQLWAGVAGGVVQSNQTRSQHYQFVNQAGSPTAVLQAGPTLALVAFGGRIYALHTDTGLIGALPHDFGDVTEMVRGNGGQATIAAKDGLYVRDLAGHMTQHLKGKRVWGAAYDALDGVYATTDDALVLLKADGTLAEVGSFSTPGPHPLTVDGVGDVWAASGSDVLQFHVGGAIAFGAIKPILQRQCMCCHQAKTAAEDACAAPDSAVRVRDPSAPEQKLSDFNVARGLGQTIVNRVLGTGAIMPPQGQLQPQDYGLIVRWYRSGETQ